MKKQGIFFLEFFFGFWSKSFWKGRLCFFPTGRFQTPVGEEGVLFSQILLFCRSFWENHLTFPFLSYRIRNKEEVFCNWRKRMYRMEQRAIMPTVWAALSHRIRLPFFDSALYPRATLEIKSGKSPLIVAAVPQFILTLRTTRRRSYFEEFPME